MFHIFQPFIMIRYFNIFLVLGLLLTSVACEDNQPVELVDESTGEEETEIEVSVLGFEADTTGTGLAVDTTGLLRSESSRYAASMIVSGVQFDTPSEHHEVSFAHVVFLDPTDPIQMMGHIIGFGALDMGRVFLDGMELHRFAHRLRRDIPPFADTLAGVRYGLLNRDGQGDRDFEFQPTHRYNWSLEGNNRIQPRSALIESPGRVNVTFPTPESSISKNHPLEILWDGQRPETIIISGVKLGPNQQLRALLKILVPRRTQRIIIPEKVMRLLPTDRFDGFLLTFQASKSREIFVLGYPLPVLLHVASVHNVLVRIR